MLLKVTGCIWLLSIRKACCFGAMLTMGLELVGHLFFWFLEYAVYAAFPLEVLLLIGYAAYGRRAPCVRLCWSGCALLFVVLA